MEMMKQSLYFVYITSVGIEMMQFVLIKTFTVYGVKFPLSCLKNIIHNCNDVITWRHPIDSLRGIYKKCKTSEEWKREKFDYVDLYSMFV